MISLSREQRRARLARRHHLVEPAGDVAEAAHSVVAVHSSDPVTVFLSMWARVDGFEVADLEAALYEQRSLVRHWGMRRTLWVTDRALLPDMIGSSTNSIGQRERRRSATMIEKGGVAEDGEAWLRDVLPKTLEAVRASGPLFARDLTRQIPELGDKITFTNQAGRVMGTTGMSSRALTQLGMESSVVRARPAGTWVSGQYSWAEIEDWLGSPLVVPPEPEASARVVQRWLETFGPGSENDLKWWTGWPVTRVRRALEAVEAVPVDLGEDGTGFLLPDDLDEVTPPEPWVAFLPSLDSTPMGWKERDWFLGSHQRVLFDINGNAGPTVWINGRVVGGWAQRKDGGVVFELLEEVTPVELRSIESTRDGLQEWLAPVVVTPRFRSPMDRSLAP